MQEQRTPFRVVYPDNLPSAPSILEHVASIQYRDWQLVLEDGERKRVTIRRRIPRRVEGKGECNV